MNNNLLITIANQLDQKGKHELADAVDKVVKSAAGRPKAPLKSLDEDVKKDLIKFLATVKKNMESSAEALEELFRRLRYFDIADVVKDLGLDKVLKDMEKTQDCMDNATKSMFSMIHGKKPSKSDMDQMADDFGLEKQEKESPLKFFEGQNISQKRDEAGLDENELLGEIDNERPNPDEEADFLNKWQWGPDDEIEDDEVDDFWSGDEDNEE